MSLWNVNYRKLVWNVLPHFLRLEDSLKFLYAAIKPLKDVNDRFDQLQTDINYDLQFNGQTIYLEHILNDTFDNSLRRIYISNIHDSVDSNYIYQASELAEPIYLYRFMPPDLITNGSMDGNSLSTDPGPFGDWIKGKSNAAISYPEVSSGHATLFTSNGHYNWFEQLIDFEEGELYLLNYDIDQYQQTAGTNPSQVLITKPDFIVNGGFDADSDWDKGAGTDPSIIASGVASFNITKVSGFPKTSFLFQLSPITNGKNYLIKFEVTNFSLSGANAVAGIQILDNTFTDIYLDEPITANGSYQFNFTMGEDGGAYIGLYASIGAGAGTVIFDVDNVQLFEIAQEISSTGSKSLSFTADALDDRVRFMSVTDSTDDIFEYGVDNVTLRKSLLIGDEPPVPQTYLSQVSEFSPDFDFIVNVPSAITFNEAEMRKLINRYRNAGYLFDIVYF